MPVVKQAELAALYNSAKADHIRNFCIIGHVDHGKTTLTDSLISSNGIISERIAGKVRYMDSREDEQQRCITMKSSGISLLFNLNEKAYLMNLIDSPGHIDFSAEVSAGLRVCDGAVVLVDVVEGVCIQTHTVLRQAMRERVRPVLVLNKIDRFITQLQLTSDEAELRLRKVLEQVNVAAATIHAETVMELAANTEDDFFEKLTDEEIFSPSKGNVLFASAIDGWGFRISDFAKIISRKTGIKEDVLQKTLWGNYYLNAKEKTIQPIKIATTSSSSASSTSVRKSLFVTMILDNVWQAYKSMLQERDDAKVEKIIKSLSLEVPKRELTTRDNRDLLRSVMRRWLPLSNGVLEMCVSKLPSPSEAQKIRFEGFWRDKKVENELKKSVDICDGSANVPVVIFVSKVFAVGATGGMDSSSISSNNKDGGTRIAMPKPRAINAPRPSQNNTVLLEKPKDDWISELPSEKKKGKRGETNKSKYSTASVPDSLPLADLTLPGETQVLVPAQMRLIDPPQELNSDVDPTTTSISSNTAKAKTTGATTSGNALPEPDREKFVAFARIFSGTLKRGQEIYVLGPRYEYGNAEKEKYFSKFTANEIYMLMGRNLEPVEEVRAGNIFGIGNVEGIILKTATLSSTLICPTFTPMELGAPIVRVAVEPVQASDMTALTNGLKMLNNADPSVKISVQPSGEQVIIASGEVHLERCLKDLREEFAKVPIHASKPIVNFRETIVEDPIDPTSTDATKEKTVLVDTASKHIHIRIRAEPLPEAITKVLEKNVKTIRSAIIHKSTAHMDKLQNLLLQSFATSGWSNKLDQIWSFGPRLCGPNILFNEIQDYLESPNWKPVFSESTLVKLPCFEEKENLDELSDLEWRLNQLSELQSGVISGFQMATYGGPLCEEPLTGVGVFIEAIDFKRISYEELSKEYEKYGPIRGQVASAVKEGCKEALLKRSLRLVEPMYVADVQVHADNLGSAYAVLSKRRCKIIKEDRKEGTSIFEIQCLLPVAESFGFANEILRKTSGSASTQLIFSHYEILEKDPFFVPKTEDEIEEYGDNIGAIPPNLARVMIDDVRRRKGLYVEEKMVEKAEKQRTLSKKK